jgi:hypothetical protein
MLNNSNISSAFMKRYGRNTLQSGTDSDRADNINRARAYVTKMPGAIAGKGGDKLTFYVACILAEKFKLSYDDMFDLMLEYNERCEPPWSKDEIIHKIECALAQVGKPKAEKLRKPDGVRAARLRPSLKPVLPGTRPFTMDDVVALSRLRRIPPHGIMLAAKRGFLFRIGWHEQECYGVRDASGNLIELRRLDGHDFPAVPSHGIAARKSHAIKGSNKSWPLGILMARDFPAIALVEGIPDFLYAHYRVQEEFARNRVAVVAMLSATPAIDEAALSLFAGKTVRIFPHLDEAGLGGAKKWCRQLIEAGARHVDFFNLSGFKKRDGKQVKDLCDLTALSSDAIKNQIRNILP